MSAESQLYNAALFAMTPSTSALEIGLHPFHVDLALEYLTIVKSLKTRTSISAVKGHLFKLMLPGLAKAKDLRAKLGTIRNGDNCLDEYVNVVKELKARMEVRPFLPICLLY